MLVVKIKKQKAQKRFIIIRKLKYEYYKNSLEATQLEDEINHLERNQVDIDSIGISNS